MWYASQPINYYYLGQYFAAYLTKLSFTASNVSYNLMMATLFAVSFMGAYSIGEFLFEIYEQNDREFMPLKYAKTVCGLLCGALVTLSGSLHTVIYAWFNNHGQRYWFPDATRYIGYNPPVADDGTIHEFPLYSYVVSDLHAHVLNMIFVLTVIAAVIAACMWILKRSRDTEDSGDLANLLANPAPYLILFLIGLFPASNFWDFPIYLVVTAVVYLYANLRAYNFSIKSLTVTVCEMIVTCGASMVIVLPFQMNFTSQYQGIAWVTKGSRLYQLLVLYGYQLAFFIMLAVTAYTAYKHWKPAEAEVSAHKGNAHVRKAVDGRGDSLLVKVDESQRSPLFNFLERINPADAIALILFCCAFGLIIIPEIIYVKDIYPNNPRANTMFKLTYQAFILLTLSIGYSFARMFLRRGEKGVREVLFMVLSVILLFCAFIYPFYAIGDWYGSQHFSNYKGLDGTKYMLTYSEDLKKIENGGAESADDGTELSLDDDYYVIQYINKNIKGQPVVAEANDLSYTSFGRIASNTGLPDIFNWYTHQQLWRNSDFEAFNERVNDIQTLYTSTDEDAVKAVIAKYNVSYIVIGKLERAKFYNNVNESLLRSLGTVVFQQNDTILIQVNK
jgi:YYY domain-containing protein